VEDPPANIVNMADQTFEDREPQVAGDPPDGEASQELQDLRRERDELHDRLLRTAAEFDNYRKRVERDRRELAEFAAADALTDMLSIVDNLERALQAAPSGDPEALRKGVELIHRQMVDLLHKRGARSIEALGADFDPTIHQAVVHESSDRHREGEVMEELQRGYMLGGRLLRPAMVKVAKPS
jgi:molecular chaperone GrpE